MKLGNNWQHVLKTAWSIRWMAAAAVFSALEVYLQFVSPEALPAGWLAALSAVAAAAGFYTRLMVQGDKNDKQ